SGIAGSPTISSLLTRRSGRPGPPGWLASIAFRWSSREAGQAQGTENNNEVRSDDGKPVRSSRRRPMHALARPGKPLRPKVRRVMRSPIHLAEPTQQARPRSIRALLVVLFVVPLVSLLALWGFAASVTLSSAIQEHNFTVQNQLYGGPAQNLG